MERQATKPDTMTNAADPAHQKKDYIGCLMSLISKQEIRYAGTLIAINSKDQTLVLQNVKSYGSEGRRGGGSDEVTPNNQVYEKVSFRASELKDFYVIKGPEKDFKDPAIISSEKIVDKPQDKSSPAKVPSSEYHQREYHGYHESYRARDFIPRKGGYKQRVRGRFEGKFQENINKEVKDKYSDEFDFAKMNKKFEELFKETEQKVDAEAGYDKAKSFFDAISRNNDESPEAPYDKAKQRKIDADTFDFDPEYRGRRSGYNPRYRRSWRGRYRRGGFRPGYGRRGPQPFYRRRG